LAILKESFFIDVKKRVFPYIEYSTLFRHVFTENILLGTIFPLCSKLVSRTEQNLLIFQSVLQASSPFDLSTVAEEIILKTLKDSFASTKYQNECISVSNLICQNIQNPKILFSIFNSLMEIVNATTQESERCKLIQVFSGICNNPTL
jgi:hypothetical protein